MLVAIFRTKLYELLSPGLPLEAAQAKGAELLVTVLSWHDDARCRDIRCAIQLL